MRNVSPGDAPGVQPGPRSTGFTLVELAISLAIAAILGAISLPAYDAYLERARIKIAVLDIRRLETLIEAYKLQWETYPPTLAAVDAANMRDPWGNPYAYLRIQGGGLKDKGKLRKDKFLNPLNSDFDLYSAGPDGDSKTPLTAPVSHDDIIRANNGGFVGTAEDF
jgi:general secretion pathway protein G